MKTIDEAAKEHYEETDWSTYEDDRIISAFKAGAEWMKKQYEEKLRWIPISEKENRPKNYERVLVKTERGFISTAIYYQSKDYFMIEKLGSHEVVEWRRIEIE